MREQDRRALAAADDVQDAVIVGVDVDLGVERRDERRVGIGVVAVTHARDDRALGAVRRAEHTGGHAGDDAGALEDVARVHPRYRRGTRAPIPVTIS